MKELINLSTTATPFIASAAPRQISRVVTQMLLIPTGIGGVLGAVLMQAFTWSHPGWVGAGGGVAGAILYLILRNFFAERRDLLDRFERSIDNLEARHAKRLEEEQQLRHALANELNTAHLMIFNMVMAVKPQEVDAGQFHELMKIYKKGQGEKVNGSG